MGLISRIFGTNKAIETGAEMLDKSFYTEQEKANAWGKFLTLYEPFKLIQRLIAFIYLIPFVLFWIVWVCVYYYGFFTIDFNTIIIVQEKEYLHQELYFSKLKDLANIIIEVFGYPVLTIVLFMFGGGALEGFARSRINKI